jgi:Ser/Thr protein kinase RdoA (MazF antagonist)
VRAVEVAARAGLLDAASAARVVAGASSAGALPAGGRALHGDPHPRNLLATAAGGIAWNDFEDAFAGPLEWDLGILRRTAALDGARALAAYEAAAGVRADPDLLAACIRVRDWQALCWTFLSAVARPERRAGARQLLARRFAN